MGLCDRCRCLLAASHRCRLGDTHYVPFAPETAASGIGETGFFQACWYRRSIDIPELGHGERLILHFGAVDYAATVWIGDTLVARHEGGHTPFKANITGFVDGSGTATIAVRAEDDPHDLATRLGKQDWMLEPHSIWYPRTTGIWQTVWFERVPASAITDIRWRSDLEEWALSLDACIDGVERADLRLQVRLHVGDLLLADDTYQVVAGEVHRLIRLSDPGIDDYRNELLWSPRSPTLTQAEIELWGKRGECIDSVRSYTALRSIILQRERMRHFQTDQHVPTPTSDGQETGVPGDTMSSVEIEPARDRQ